MLVALHQTLNMFCQIKILQQSYKIDIIVLILLLRKPSL